MGEQLKLRGVLSGHGGWVTAIATTVEDPSMILTSSRDKVLFYSICLKDRILILIFCIAIVDHYCMDFDS